jgi:hypothetical protein
VAGGRARADADQVHEVGDHARVAADRADVAGDCASMKQRLGLAGKKRGRASSDGDDAEGVDVRDQACAVPRCACPSVVIGAHA